MLGIAIGECDMENADAFVDSLREEKFAQEKGVVVYPQGLLLQTLTAGN
jgi:hypothetical protein